MSGTPGLETQLQSQLLLRRLKKMDHKFKSNLGNFVKTCIKIKIGLGIQLNSTLFFL